MSLVGSEMHKWLCLLVVLSTWHSTTSSELSPKRMAKGTSIELSSHAGSVVGRLEG